MPLRPPAILALALFPLAACAAADPAPAPFEPLEVRGTFPVTYEARVAGRGVGEMTSIARGDRLSEEAPAATETPQFEIGCELIRLDAGTAARLFDWSPADPKARTVDMARIRELLDSEDLAGRISLITTPSVLLIDGQRGAVTVCNQTAYISHFDLLMAEGCAVADPVVDVISDGVFLDLRATSPPGSARVQLELDLEVVKLHRPIPVVEVAAPGSSARVAFQQPVLSTQRLTTSADVGPTECLILTAFDGEDPDSRLFAFLTARRLTEREVESMKNGSAPPPAPR